MCKQASVSRTVQTRGGGGGAKAVYKLYKKTGEMVKGAFPKPNSAKFALQTAPFVALLIHDP